MNYYPTSFYQNYPYNNTHSNYSQMQPPQPAAQTVVPTPQNSNMGLQGKIVDSEEMVKVSEIPFGGYGFFPKADLSEIFIKTWNPNGTTRIMSYKPSMIEELNNDKEDFNKIILEKIQNLELKIDSLSNNNSNSNQDTRKEIKINEY